MTLRPARPGGRGEPDPRVIRSGLSSRVIFMGSTELGAGSNRWPKRATRGLRELRLPRELQHEAVLPRRRPEDTTRGVDREAGARERAIGQARAVLEEADRLARLGRGLCE